MNLCVKLENYQESIRKLIFRFPNPNNIIQRKEDTMSWNIPIRIRFILYENVQHKYNLDSEFILYLFVLLLHHEF